MDGLKDKFEYHFPCCLPGGDLVGNSLKRILVFSFVFCWLFDLHVNRVLGLSVCKLVKARRIKERVAAFTSMETLMCSYYYITIEAPSVTSC